MVELELQDIVAGKTVMEKYPRSFLSLKIIGRIIHLGEYSPPRYLGSWSRGYDVALTWRRSQVQFLPSPPDNIIQPLGFFKSIGKSDSTLTFVFLTNIFYEWDICCIVNMCTGTWAQINPFYFYNP